jgi:hypothetical protein
MTEVMRACRGSEGGRGHRGRAIISLSGGMENYIIFMIKLQKGLKFGLKKMIFIGTEKETCTQEQLLKKIRLQKFLLILRELNIFF